MAVEIPILVYQESERWVAESILTGTSFAERDRERALSGVLERLESELHAALSAADGHVAPALRSVWMTPAPGRLRRYFLSESVPTRARSPLPGTMFVARVAG